jgi:hypothetical protein
MIATLTRSPVTVGLVYLLPAPRVPAGGLSLTIWGDCCEYRGEGHYSPDADGLLTLTGDNRRGLWIAATDIQEG